jgi:hypothetical protein
MADDDSIPFAIAGKVVTWDPANRVLYVGSARLTVAPGVDTALLTPSQPVTVTGYRPPHPDGSWVVTKIQVYQPGF